MKKIALEELEKRYGAKSYEELVQLVCRELKQGRIRPVKAAGTNGKKPALYVSYWLSEEKRDDAWLKEELKYALSPVISPDYYLNHLSVYEEERPNVLLLDTFLKANRTSLAHPVSVNERSFAVWGEEKFLTRGGGRKLLSHCGLSMEFLNVYATAEPLAYYSHTRSIPQDLLILENKDPFYSMRRHLMEGNHTILGCQVGTLIYGAGKGIYRSFPDFSISAEPFMLDEKNRIFYFGDLDYEGIGIYENLAARFSGGRRIRLFWEAYAAMIRKARSRFFHRGEKTAWEPGDFGVLLPSMQEKQNSAVKGNFFAELIREADERGEAAWGREAAKEARRILDAGCYIPQEILSQQDF